MPDAYREQPIHHWRTSVVIVGSGVAGGHALALAPPVLLLTKTPVPEGLQPLRAGRPSPPRSAMGIAGESCRRHHQCRCRDGRCRSGAAARPRRRRGVRALIDAGVPFDRAGAITLGREAAHSFARIIHAGGDFTGRNLVGALLRMVAATPSVRVISECFVVELVKHDGRVSGVLAYQAHEGWVRVHANHVVLATGGIGNLWRETTNPAEGTGDGLALAVRAGASLADLEFVQFHPTALLPAQHGDVRAAARRKRCAGRRAAAGRIRPQVHARRAPASGVGAPRHRRPCDRAACRRGRAGAARPASSARGEGRGELPQALTLCGQHGLRPSPRAGAGRSGRPLPHGRRCHRRVVARTSTGSACGEVAMTGVHGANRLASNSLLEGFVFGQRVAEDIRRAGSTTTPVADSRRSMPTASACRSPRRRRFAASYARSWRLTWVSSDPARACGRQPRRARRCGRASASSRPSRSRWARELLDDPALRRARNMLDVARLVILAALRRTESRGAHFRADCPEPRAEWQCRLVLTMADIDRASSQVERPRVTAS